MARIAGIDIPKNKRGVISLTYIFGIGNSRASKILDTAGVDHSKKVSDWSDAEISKIRENKTFIAKKSKTFDEEKKVANKAPVKSISINEIGTPKSKELDDRRSFNYSIKITEFYFLKNAKELKKRIENETSLKNINIISINDTKHQVLLGPYSNINTLQSAYNSINNLNFENIELIRND